MVEKRRLQVDGTWIERVSIATTVGGGLGLGTALPMIRLGGAAPTGCSRVGGPGAGM